MTFYFCRLFILQTDADFSFITGCQPSLSLQINTGFLSPVALKNDITSRLAHQMRSELWQSFRHLGSSVLNFGLWTRNFAYGILLSEKSRACGYICNIYGWECMCFREIHQNIICAYQYYRIYMGDLQTSFFVIFCVSQILLMRRQEHISLYH